MALQHFVKPSRAAPHGTDSQEGWQTTVYRTAVPRQTSLSFLKFQATASKAGQAIMSAFWLIRKNSVCPAAATPFGELSILPSGSCPAKLTLQMPEMRADFSTGSGGSNLQIWLRLLRPNKLSVMPKHEHSQALATRNISTFWNRVPEPCVLKEESLLGENSKIRRRGSHTKATVNC